MTVTDRHRRLCGLAMVSFVSVMACFAVGLRPTASHHHDGGMNAHRHVTILDGNRHHTHNHGSQHSHEHDHTHSYNHKSLDGAHNQNSPNLAKEFADRSKAIDLVASQPHTHYVFFGFQFTIAELKENRLTDPSSSPSLAFDTSRALCRLLDFRSPMPPVGFEFTVSLACSTTPFPTCIVDGRGKDLPIVPPPEFASA